MSLHDAHPAISYTHFPHPSLYLTV